MSNGVSARLPALGPRGEGWVAVQLALYGGLLWSGLRSERWPPGARRSLRALSLPLGAAGGMLIVKGSIDLGGSLTPNPRPRDQGDLKDAGVYRLVRHPIYGGVILAAAAWSLWWGPASVPSSLLTGALLELKSRREEAWLVERYPAYAGYRDRVPRRFLPFLW